MKPNGDKRIEYSPGFYCCNVLGHMFYQNIQSRKNNLKESNSINWNNEKSKKNEMLDTTLKLNYPFILSFYILLIQFYD